MGYDTAIPGYIGYLELGEIEELAKQVPSNGVIVEVGSLFGRSTVAWASSCDPSVSIYCFDTFDDHYASQDFKGVSVWDTFQRNTAPYKNVIPIKGYVPIDAKYTDLRQIDLFFLDAQHENPVDWNIIEYFLPFIKSGGIISGHDYNTLPNIGFPDVVENVHRLEKMFDQKAKLVDSVWSLKKP